MSGNERERGVEEVSVGFLRPLSRAKLFAHGGSQAVRLPKAFRFEGTEVTVRREGEQVILEAAPAAPPGTPAEWSRFWAAIDGLVGGEFPDREQPAMQERDWV
ncbi:MAG: AbrB/MazE/SpoVT family DNA-binding domain-containing protein [Caulobacteraceae bacterium]